MSVLRAPRQIGCVGFKHLALEFLLDPITTETKPKTATGTEYRDKTETEAETERDRCKYRDRLSYKWIVCFGGGTPESWGEVS